MCVCAMCVSVCAPPPPPTPHPPPAALPVHFSSEGRCCLTHTRYTQTIGQTAVLAQVLAESTARRMREIDTDCQKDRNKERGELVFTAVVVWCEGRERRVEVWWRLREGMGAEGQVSLITQHRCYHNTTKPRHTYTVIKIKTNTWRSATGCLNSVGSIVCC